MPLLPSTVVEAMVQQQRRAETQAKDVGNSTWTAFGQPTELGSIGSPLCTQLEYTQSSCGEYESL